MESSNSNDVASNSHYSHIDPNNSKMMEQWQITVQNLRAVKKDVKDIPSMVVRYFKDISSIEIVEFMSQVAPPKGVLLSGVSTITSEDLLNCICTLLVEMNPISTSRGVFLGTYLHIIHECKKSKELLHLHKEHLNIFKSLNL